MCLLTSAQFVFCRLKWLWGWRESLVGRYKLLFIHGWLLGCRASSAATSTTGALTCFFEQNPLGWTHGEQKGIWRSGDGKSFLTILLVHPKLSHQLVIKMYVCILKTSDIDRGNSIYARISVLWISAFAYVSEVRSESTKYTELISWDLNRLTFYWAQVSTWFSM